MQVKQPRSTYDASMASKIAMAPTDTSAGLADVVDGLSQGVAPKGSAESGEKARLSTDDRVTTALVAIGRVMEAGHPIALAYSGGKDSSVLMALVLEAARQRAGAKLRVPQILVTHARTGIENPAMETVINSELRQIRKYVAQHNLPVRIDIAEPSLNDSWAVRIISGRALPTFANSPTRDCSVSWKIKPQERQRKRTLKELGALGQPVTMTGTRFEESASRAARMTDRGELDTDIWQDEKRDASGKLIRHERRMSPIAYWTQEDVWTFLSELASGVRVSYTDAKDIWDIYRDGGNSSCVVVSDDAMKASAKACGARFGCSLCTAVGRDKSLEAMLEADIKYRYLLPLNRLQRFLVDTQYDLRRRQWLGRSITEDGYVAIAPDAYSSEMQRDLLRYALTIDADEAGDAWAHGVVARFQLVSLSQLIAIDAIWSMQGYQPRPFEAIWIWSQVYEQGLRFYPPEVDSQSFDKKLPAPKWLYVGADYDDDPGFDHTYSGARSLVADLSGLTDELTGCLPNIDLGNGRLALPIETSDFFSIDEQAAADFFVFEVEDYRIHERYAKYGPGAAFQHYLQLGLISTSMRHYKEQDAMLRRAAWKARHGVFDLDVEQLLALSVTKAEREVGKKSPRGMITLREQLQIRLSSEHLARQEVPRRQHAMSAGTEPPISSPCVFPAQPSKEIP
jgi:DNA sulfur modification protein DndC